MATLKKVHQLAKELGVDSKAIIAKCTAEGIGDLKTHNSPVKIGLEMTIREWFSEAHQTKTAIETADHVDVEKARKTARKRKPTKGHAGGAGGDEESSGSTATATATAEAPPPVRKGPPSHAPPEPPADEQVTGESTEAVAEPPTDEQITTTPTARVTTPAHPAPHAPAGPVTTTTTPLNGGGSSATGPAGPRASASAPSTVAPRPPVTPAGRPNVPTRPTVVSPAGRSIKDIGVTKTALKGPTVVRVEQPDVIEQRRPRGPRPGGGGGPPQNEPGTVPGISRSRGPTRGGGVRGPATDEEGGDRSGGAAAANKRRSLTARRGRYAEALPTGPTKLTDADLQELDARLNRATGFVKQRRRDLKKHVPGQPQAGPTTGHVEISEPITIKSLSSATGIKATEIIKYLFGKGVMSTINSAITSTMAQEVAMEHDLELEVKEQQTAEQEVVAEFESREATDLRPRPAVVTVLGHVDHGKTSLLDAIRHADVAAHESGGITQHVGAYRVSITDAAGKKRTVVFLDTPGHEAFTSMRARGASMTDLVVLVVAADDGVMPTTVESINHAKAANVPIIVALNKIDKAEATEANVRKIYGQLAEHGLNPTEWGGTTEVIKTSATKKTGVTELLEVLDYQAELRELKADYGGAARGTVIESLMVPGRGPVARVLVQQGVMKIGDFIVVGRAFGRVRDMTDERRKAVAEAGPSTPLELSGIDVLPDAGDKFYVTDTLNQAEEIATQYRDRERQKQLASQTKVTLENFADQLAAGATKDLRVVLKADVQGSIDVIKKSLTDLSTREVAVKVLHAAVGGITESDVILAEASDAVIIGFHVIAPTVVRDLAEQKHVEIRLYRVIYEATDEIRKALEGMLEPEKKEEQLGIAEVRQVFDISKVGMVAGCMVTEGTIQRNGKMRLVRDNVVVTDERNIETLRRLKEDAKEVRAGLECGIRIAGFTDIKIGDKLICYNTVMVKRKLGA